MSVCRIIAKGLFRGSLSMYDLEIARATVDLDSIDVLIDPGEPG